MQDRVGEILASRAAIGDGGNVALAAAVGLHAALAGVVVWAAMHATPIQNATVVSINFMKMPGVTTAAKPARSSKRAIH